MYDIRDLPGRTAGECYETIEHLWHLSGTALRNYRRDTGIREGCILFYLPGMNPYESFPQDITHTFENVQGELLRLMKSDKYEDGFSLSPMMVARMDEE